MTPNEIFHQAVNYLLSMSQRATDKGKCCYRTPNGSRCVAGYFIPDKVYDPVFEGKSLSVLFTITKSSSAVLSSAVLSSAVARLPTWMHNETNWKFLHQLQSIHDYAGNWHSKTGINYIAVERLLRLAKSYNININPELEAKMRRIK